MNTIYRPQAKAKPFQGENPKEIFFLQNQFQRRLRRPNPRLWLPPKTKLSYHPFFCKIRQGSSKDNKETYSYLPSLPKYFAAFSAILEPRNPRELTRVVNKGQLSHLIFILKLLHSFTGLFLLFQYFSDFFLIKYRTQN